MSYTGTFIQTSDDCPASEAVVPTSTRDKKPVHLIEYELLSQHPYTLTQEDLIFQVHVRRNGIKDDELKARGDAIREELFQKSHPCLRASALPKRYGWGAHCDEQGRIALYAVESEDYKRLASPEGDLKQLKAMRSKRA